VLRAPELNAHSRWGLTRVEMKGRITPSPYYPITTLLLMQPRIWLAFWAAKRTLLAHVIFLPPLSPSASVQWRDTIHPSVCADMRIAPTQVQDLALGLVESYKVHMGPQLKADKASLPSSLSTAPLSLVSSANLLRVH